MLNITSSNFYTKLLEDLKDEALVYKLSYELGGQRFYIPNKARERHLKNHFLCVNYGEKFFKWVVENYGGCDVVIPLGANSSYKRNQIQAEILAQRGFSRNEIARALSIHYSSAQRATRRMKNQKQQELF